MSITRRKFLGAAGAVTAGAAIAKAGWPSAVLADKHAKTVNVGMNIPMTGDYAPWGLPGKYGCDIVARDLNAAGGVKIGGDTYMIRVLAYDHVYDLEKVVQGYKKLVKEDDCKCVMMLGGASVGSILTQMQRSKMLTTTLLPSDITPESEYLIATCESHPLYNATGAMWLAENFPEAKKAVIVTGDDAEYGLQSAATYMAAFEVSGIEVIDMKTFGFDVTDFAPIVSSALASKPDIFCMGTTTFTTPLMEQLYHQGYKGKIVSCTLDNYAEAIAKTSKEFVNGTIFQFPDFDDPALMEEGISFPDPGGFYAKFIKDHPESWSAVAWEYPAILLNWLEGAKKAGSVEPTEVLQALKATRSPEFVFGEGEWWGSQLWGLDNAVVGRWPVVVIEDGKARIQEYRSLAGWLKKNVEVLRKHLKELGLPIV